MALAAFSAVLVSLREKNVLNAGAAGFNLGMFCLCDDVGRTPIGTVGGDDSARALCMYISSDGLRPTRGSAVDDPY